MPEKLLVEAAELVDALNVALKIHWPGPEHQCEIVSVHCVAHPDRNWEVNEIRTDGCSIALPADCIEAIQRTVASAAELFDVCW